MALWTNQGYVHHLTSLREYVHTLESRDPSQLPRTESERTRDLFEKQFLSRLRIEALQSFNLDDDPNRFIFCDWNYDYSSQTSMNSMRSHECGFGSECAVFLHTFISMRREEEMWVLEKALLAVVDVPFHGALRDVCVDEDVDHRKIDDFIADETTASFITGKSHIANMPHSKTDPALRPHSSSSHVPGRNDLRSMLAWGMMHPSKHPAFNPLGPTWLPGSEVDNTEPSDGSLELCMHSSREFWQSVAAVDRWAGEHSLAYSYDKAYSYNKSGRTPLGVRHPRPGGTGLRAERHHNIEEEPGKRSPIQDNCYLGNESATKDEMIALGLISASAPPSGVSYSAMYTKFRY